VEFKGFVRILELYVTKLAPHKALQLIASGKLTFDEKVVIHRGDGMPQSHPDEY
jgi:hypothetical protein